MKPATAINVRHILCEKHSRAMEALEQIQVSKSLGVVYLFVRIGLVLLWVQEQNFSLYDVNHDVWSRFSINAMGLYLSLTHIFIILSLEDANPDFFFLLSPTPVFLFKLDYFSVVWTTFR